MPSQTEHTTFYLAILANIRHTEIVLAPSATMEEVVTWAMLGLGGSWHCRDLEEKGVNISPSS